MGKRKYTGLCIDCGERPATNAPYCCERCWRRRRYHDPNDNYRDMVRERKVAYRQRHKQSGRTT